MEKPTMTTNQTPAPILRRLGDVIQGLAVIAIAGLVVVIMDLRITIVHNQDMIAGQDKLHLQNFKALRENIALQMNVLESVVQRATINGFNASHGIALQENVKMLRAKMEKNEMEIRKLYDMIYKELQLRP
jgi:hypothetical protein